MAGSDWRSTSLGEVMILQRGFDLPQADRRPGSFPVIASTGPVGEHVEAKVHGPGVVIGRSGSIGGGQYIETDFWPLNTTLWVKDFQGNVPRFCYYLLKTIDFSRFNAGSGVPTLNRNHVHPLPVRLPPLPEQRAIAAVLGALDDKIEVNRKTARVLEGIARAVFTSWFVDFDPVRRRANSGSGSAASLPADLAAIFPKRLVDSPIGEVPKGWRVGALGEVCEKPQYGLTASAADEAVGPKFLRITDINKEPWINWSTVPFCEIPAGEDAAKCRLRKGDLVIARMADPGHAALIEEDREAVFASYLIRFRPRTAEAARYLQYWTRSSAYWDLVHGRKTGSTRATLNATELGELPLLVPSVPVQVRFSAFVDSIRARGVHAISQSATLAALRDALLPKLISGELRIADTEKIVEKAESP